MSDRSLFRTLRLGALAAVVGAVGLAATLTAEPAAANHSWGLYHWARTANPLMLNLGDNVSQAWDAYLIEASTDWTSSLVLHTTVVPGLAGGGPSRCSPTAGRSEVCSYAYGKRGWLGLASIWVNADGHITQGTVKLNDSYFGTNSSYNTPPWRRLVTCQEVGHEFGLAHQDENFDNANLGTCMDYARNPSGPPSNEHPNAHDYVELRCKYEAGFTDPTCGGLTGHLDTTTTVGSLTPALASLPFIELRAAAVTAAGPDDEDLNSPGAWGRLVAEGNGGRTALYERDLGGGQRMLTRVIWAEPRGRR